MSEVAFNANPYWLSVSGAPLRGSKLVRFVYMDESSPDKDPWHVEAAIIASPDHHFEPMAQLFEEARSKYIPEIPRSAAFHAADVWSGKEEFALYKECRRDTLHKYLEEVMSIPDKLSIPIACGFSQKKLLPFDVPLPNEKDKIRKFRREVPVYISFLSCVLSAEAWLRQHARDEISIIIHEDADQHIRDMMRNKLRAFQSPELIRAAGAPDGMFPLVRIKDEMMFASKGGSKFLQLADACAYIIGRQIRKHADIAHLFKKISGQIVPPYHESLNRELFS